MERINERMNERKSNEDRKEWGYESKEMQFNIVNLDRMQENQTRCENRNSVEITNICICAKIYNFNYE